MVGLAALAAVPHHTHRTPAVHLYNTVSTIHRTPAIRLVVYRTSEVQYTDHKTHLVQLTAQHTSSPSIHSLTWPCPERSSRSRAQRPPLPSWSKWCWGGSPQPPSCQQRCWGGRDDSTIKHQSCLPDIGSHHSWII